MEWTLYKWLPSGHRMFRTPDDPRLAIADRSGPTPDTTEDGVLWLDPTREICLSDTSFGWLAPLLDPDGRRCGTPVDSATAALLSAECHMTLRTERHRARACKQIGRNTTWVTDPASGAPLKTADLILGEQGPGRAPTLAGWLCQLT